jgi:hypothetical protein
LPIEKLGRARVASQGVEKRRQGTLGLNSLLTNSLPTQNQSFQQAVQSKIGNRKSKIHSGGGAG